MSALKLFTVSTWDSLFSVISTVNPSLFSNFLLLGDFNVNVLKPSPQNNHLTTIKNCFQLTQVVNETTHFRHDGGSAIIDLVFTSEPENLTSCCTIPPLGSSDHQGIMVRFRKKKDVCLTQGRGGTIWRYNHADWERANQKISDMNLDQIFCGDDIDLCWTRWKTAFLKIMDDCIPKARLPDSLNPPWITKHILQLIRKRNTWYKKSCRNRESDLFRRYKVLRSKIHSLI